MRARIIQLGETCSRRELARRVSFLVDGESYFRALYEALETAERSVLVVGWDVSVRTELLKEQAGERPRLFGDLLNSLAQERPELDVRVLCWNFPIAYAAGRDPPRWLGSRWRSHERVKFHFDDRHPIGASHHQKLVVIDDELAFAGGFDVTCRRWDTPAHAPDDPRRRLSDGTSYPPFHDIQMLVQGPAAAALGHIARERWMRATGELLEAPRSSTRVRAWPASAPIEASDVTVAISVTYPNFDGHAEQREVEAITLGALRSARDLVYIENQYLASKDVADVMIESLSRPTGPEIIVVLPKRAGSWLEEMTMGVLQNKTVARIKDADRYGRFGVFYPEIPGLGRHRIIVHAKVMVIDDDILKIGSSNLNNRSMGLDTECDLTLETSDDPSLGRVIRRFRNRLLSEHLGMEPSDVDANVEAAGSLLRFLNSRPHRGRGLRPLRRRTPPGLRWIEKWETVVDPTTPMKREQLLSVYLTNSRELRRIEPYLRGAVTALALLGVAALWAWVPILELREQHLTNLAGIATVFGIFVAGAALLVPTAVLAVLAITALGPWPGFLCAWAGTFVASCIQYLRGRSMTDEKVRRLVGKRADSLGRKLARIGTLPSLVLRLLPVAPLTVLNLVSGASGMGFGSFAVYTFLAIVPYTLAIAGAEWAFERLLQGAGPFSAIGLLLSAAAVVLISLGWRWRKGTIT